MNIRILGPMEVRTDSGEPKDAGYRPDETGAIWTGDPESGEKIEFFVPHRGTHAEEGRVRAVPGQEGIRGIAFDRLWMLAEHRSVVVVDKESSLQVRLPTLGAVAIYKVNTFASRKSEVGQVRAGKDLVYARDCFIPPGARRPTVSPGWGDGRPRDPTRSPP